jgi:hypothetical protein
MVFMVNIALLAHSSTALSGLKPRISLEILVQMEKKVLDP